MDSIILGRNQVLEALKAGRPINKILVLDGANTGPVRDIVAMARERKILLQFVDKSRLDFLSGGQVHQGVIAQAAAKEYADWEQILTKVTQQGEEPLFLLLDGVEDPHNLGAILRTADAVGVHCVIIPKHRAVPLTAGVARASAGAIEYVPVAQVTNLARTIDQLKEAGFWIAGTDMDAQKTHFGTDLRGPLVVVMGGESGRLGKLVKEKCDLLVRIPMRGKVNSLNVSVAASVVLYEIIRQRQAAQ